MKKIGFIREKGVHSENQFSNYSIILKIIFSVQSKI